MLLYPVISQIRGFICKKSSLKFLFVSSNSQLPCYQFSTVKSEVYDLWHKLTSVSNHVNNYTTVRALRCGQYWEILLSSGFNKVSIYWQAGVHISG